MPRIRGRLYSSCASSTWSFPSALVACWAKMSRISCVRSTTRAVERVLERVCCAGSSSSSTSSTSASRPRRPASAPRASPCRRTCAGPGAARCWHELGDRLDARGARELAQLAQLLVGVGALRQHGEHEPALGLEARAQVVWRVVTWRIVPRLRPMSDLAHRLAERTLELVDIPSRAARGGDRCARPLARAGLVRRRVRGDDAFVWARAAARRACRSSCSPATTTPCRRRRTCPAGSRTAPCTGWARPT